MKTVSQVAKLTGVSVRTLQYYDEIGVFKPTEVNDSGYRLYDDEALKTLQQILFFKELDFQLSDIKKIIQDPNFDKITAFKQQKQLIKAKCDRLNGLLGLLEKLEKGETCMSFKEFDMSEYISALDKFRATNTEAIIKNWGSVEAFDDFVLKVKDKETDVAKMAIMQYGSIEKYTEAMKFNLEHFSEHMEKLEHTKEISMTYYERNKELTAELLSDITIAVESPRIQSIVHELVKICEETTQGIDMGENFWDMIINGYLSEENIIAANDKLYGEGASNFMGRAFKYYFSKI